ncbi:MAG: hypothetical protein IKJ30_02470 [Bacilli bacterium]|nr:hypothetical protein [Bacilli bacterium]
MISSKVVKIVKENSFNQGWTLFDECDLPFTKNHIYEDVDVSNVIELVNNASVVNLILCEACLNGELLWELEKISENIKINIISRNEEIVATYPNLKVDSLKVNENLNFNYIGIIGEEIKNLMILDKFVETSNVINEIYFEGKSKVEDYSFLNQVARIVIVDRKGEKDYSKLIDAALKERIDCLYVVDPKYYSKDIFYYALTNKLDLIVGDVLKEGVILQNKNATISYLQELDKGAYTTYQIESLNLFVNDKYKCLFCDDEVNIDNLLNQVYCVSNGVVEKFTLTDTKVLFYDVKLPTISDFISEKFDTSIVEEHNNYSNKAYKVEYQFNLIPPTLDSSYNESSIYKEVYDLKSEWDELQTLKIDDIKRDYAEIMEEDVGLIDFIDGSVKFSDCLTTSISECKYEGFHKLINNAKALYENYKRSLILRCKEMFNAVNKENLNSKFDKFDLEIEGYKKTIQEKRVLIVEGIDVTSNRRSVEILEKKVADLLRLKASFESKANTISDDKGLEVFLDKCNEILNNDKQIHSISDIVRTKEITKMAKLKAFVDSYLYAINTYIRNCLSVIDRFRDINIPENYSVYEKNGERYIVIDDLHEYYDTKDLREEFNLKCIARR